MLSVLAALAVLLQAEAAAPAPQPRVVIGPDWIRRPTGQDMARFYPPAASRRGLSGRAVMNCAVTAEGKLAACGIESELPNGQGFGEATLRLAPLFRMHPNGADGSPVEGGTVRLPIRFTIMGDSAERQTTLIGAMTCYGHVADLADSTPKAPGAWQATLFWSLEVAAASANSGLRPSDYEEALSIAHREERERKSPAPDGERDACLAKGAKR